MQLRAVDRASADRSLRAPGDSHARVTSYALARSRERAARVIPTLCGLCPDIPLPIRRTRTPSGPGNGAASRAERDSRLSKRRYDRRPVEKTVHRFRGQPARNQRVIPRCERQALTSGMQTSAAALHRKAKEFSARRLGPGYRWDRRGVTATRRCGRNGGVDHRLPVWRQCVRPTAVRQDA